MSYIVGILNSVISVLSLFLICIILIQRGKGGGLAGAFGGVGGSSAFGTKAGDFFTRLTIGIAAGWICLAMLLVILTNSLKESSWDSESGTSLSKEFAPKGKDKSGATPPAIPTPATGSDTAPTATPPPAAGTSAEPAISIPAIPEIAPPAKPSATQPTPAPTPAAPAPTPKKP